MLVWQGAALFEIPLLYADPYTQRAIDVAAHVGTLAAVTVFFWRDVVHLVVGGWQFVTGLTGTVKARRFGLLALASLPLIFAGFVWSLFGEAGLERQLWVIGSASILFGLMIWWFDARSDSRLAEDDLNWRRALVFGLFQVLALIPGTSRSGITMAAGRALGFSRAAGTKIALLMSIPAILAAGSLEAFRLITARPFQAPEGVWSSAGLVLVVSALTAYVTLWLFTRFLPVTGFLPYVVYRVLLGLAVLTLAWLL